MRNEGTIAPALLSLDRQPPSPEPVIPSTSASTDIHASSQPLAGLARIDAESDIRFPYTENNQFTPTARSSMKRRRQVSSENVVQVQNSAVSKKAVCCVDLIVDDEYVEISEKSAYRECPLAVARHTLPIRKSLRIPEPSPPSLVLPRYPVRIYHVRDMLRTVRYSHSLPL